MIFLPAGLPAFDSGARTPLMLPARAIEASETFSPHYDLYPSRFFVLFCLFVYFDSRPSRLSKCRVSAKKENQTFHRHSCK